MLWVLNHHRFLPLLQLTPLFPFSGKTKSNQSFFKKETDVFLLLKLSLEENSLESLTFNYQGFGLVYPEHDDVESS